MTSGDRVETMLQDALRALSLPRASSYGDTTAWHVTFSEASSFDVEYDERGQCVVITADVGEVAEPVRLRMYEILLEYNFIWSETGGVRMALDGSGSIRQAVAILDIPVSGLDAAQLSQVLSNMAELQRAWTEILKESVAAEGQSAAANLRHGAQAMQMALKA